MPFTEAASPHGDYTKLGLPTIGLHELGKQGHVRVYKIYHFMFGSLSLQFIVWNVSYALQLRGKGAEVKEQKGCTTPE